MFDTPTGGEPGECGYVEVDRTGRYGRFGEVLGKGAMKIVYRAFDELNGIEVAWNQAKICDVLRSPEALERLYSEVNLLSTLHHDSIIKYYSFWVDSRNRTFNFITELFSSGSLREYRQKYRRVDVRAVKSWARQILHGLVYLHEHDPPVIHRDLKCDNIFVNGNLGQVKIGDLGLAAVLRNTQPARSVIGTPEFMAPEMYDEEYNELVDVYSFGMCVLEMLTAEYPYSECSNPAQIYKKVTSGQMPAALYKMQDREARRFIGRCLEDSSTRSSAKELLLDQFLQVENFDLLPERSLPRSKTTTDMKITGKINPEDDTIFLGVHFSDREEPNRNVYFPFDIIDDTPIDVANEMVKELEITDTDPSQIAEMIDKEISVLMPNWKEKQQNCDGQHHHAYCYSYDECDEGSIHHPFFHGSSSTSSRSSYLSQAYSNHNNACHSQDWIQVAVHDNYDDGDETNSHCSIYSDKFSYVNCNMGSEFGEQESSSQRRENQPQVMTSRFVPDKKRTMDNSNLPAKFLEQCGMPAEPPKKWNSNRTRRSSGRLERNRSLVDIRSQLLHRKLVEEVNKRQFKTAGAVEDVGYQNPCESSASKTKKSSFRLPKNFGFTWGSRS